MSRKRFNDDNQRQLEQISTGTFFLWQDILYLNFVNLSLLYISKWISKYCIHANLPSQSELLK